MKSKTLKGILVLCLTIAGAGVVAPPAAHADCRVCNGGGYCCR